MFTGLVEGKGRIKQISRIHGDMRLGITPQFDTSDNRIGDSISVNGVCLTITALEGPTFSVDVSGETLNSSTMGELKSGDEVNLERALRFSDRLGGHLVSGHVDGIGRIIKKERRQRSWMMRIGIEPEVARYTIEKGSIAVDGISLTINSCQDAYFEVNIIPETAGETNILRKDVGEAVNIETDMIGKYVEKFFSKEQQTTSGSKMSSRIDREMLLKHGFGE